MQSDRVDKSAKGWSEQTKPELHASQTEYKKGFGGKFGVDTEAQDKVRERSYIYVLLCVVIQRELSRCK